MKTLISFFAVAMLFFAGCAEDYTFNDDSASVELKRANVPIPFKADICAVPDMESDFILLPIPGIDPSNPENYYASRTLMRGTGTHLGNLDPEASYYETESTVFFMEAGHPFLVQSGIGEFVGANGDSFGVTWWAKISLPDRNWVGEFVVIPGSGTGKFGGISGILESIGQANPEEHTNCFTSDGYIQYYQ